MPSYEEDIINACIKYNLCCFRKKKEVIGEILEKAKADDVLLVIDKAHYGFEHESILDIAAILGHLELAKYVLKNPKNDVNYTQGAQSHIML